MHDILISIKLTETGMNVNKSQFSMSDIKIVSYVCNFNDMHLKTVKIVKIINWSSCISFYKTWAFIDICVYYCAWIKNFAAIASLIYNLFKKNKQFEWGLAQ